MSPAAVLACLAASAAVSLVVPGVAGGARDGVRAGRVPGASGGEDVLGPGGAGAAGTAGAVRPWGAAVLAVLLAALVLSPRLVVLLAVTSAAAAGVVALVRLRRSAARAVVVADRVREVCEALADDLGAGASTERALARAGADWAELEPVLAAHRLGLDVPQAWRRLAGRPGAGGLRLVAAAWEVSGRTGQGLSSALRRVAADLRAADASRRVVDSELASARATGRLVAGLPGLAWLMGSGSDQHPVGWLLAGPAGWACLTLGGGLLLLGLGWIELLARGASA